MTAPVPQALSTELAVWDAALVRRFATSVETPTARTPQTSLRSDSSWCGSWRKAIRLS
jgi:hypothetical protein